MAEQHVLTLRNRVGDSGDILSERTGTPTERAAVRLTLPTGTTVRITPDPAAALRDAETAAAEPALLRLRRGHGSTGAATRLRQLGLVVYDPESGRWTLTPSGREVRTGLLESEAPGPAGTGQRPVSGTGAPRRATVHPDLVVDRAERTGGAPATAGRGRGGGPAHAAGRRSRTRGRRGRAAGRPRPVLDGRRTRVPHGPDGLGRGPRPVLGRREPHRTGPAAGTPAARRGPGGAARHRRHARRPRTGTAAADAGGGGRGAGLAAAPPGTAAGRDARPGGPRRRGGGRGREPAAPVRGQAAHRHHPHPGGAQPRRGRTGPRGAGAGRGGGDRADRTAGVLRGAGAGRRAGGAGAPRGRGPGGGRGGRRRGGRRPPHRTEALACPVDAPEFALRVASRTDPDR